MLDKLKGLSHETIIVKDKRIEGKAHISACAELGKNSLVLVPLKSTKMRREENLDF
jgi:hypothetical protein